MTTLEKIRAEIEAVGPKSHVQYGMRWTDTTLMIPFHKVMQILDKYAEQEPCDDVVSRQAVLKIIDGWYEQNRDTENIEDLIVLITYMDSVRPQEPQESEDKG